MTYYHDASNAVGVNASDYMKTITPTNFDIEENYTVVLRPISADPNENVLLFDYPGNPISFMDLSRTVMKLECQLVDDKGAEIPKDREVYPISTTMTSIFSSRKITLGDTTFLSGEGLPYLGYFREIFSQNRIFKNTFGKTTNGFYDNDAGRMQYTKEFTDSSTKKFWVIGYLDLHPMNTQKLLPTSVPIRFEFCRTSDRFFIMDKKKSRS